MKSLVFALVLCAVTISQCLGLSEEKKQEIRKKVEPFIVECGKEHGFTLEDVKKWRAEKTLPNDSNSCFHACVFKKIGLLDNKGLYSEKVAQEKLSKYAVGEELEKGAIGLKNCIKVNDIAVSDGEKGCDRAKHLFKCVVDQKDILGY